MRSTSLALALALLGATSSLSAAVLFQPAGTGDDTVRAAATDRNGNVLMAASFSGQIPAGTSTLTASAGGDIAVLRYDGGAGTLLQAFRFGGAGTQVATGIAEDSQGNIVVVGYTRGAANANFDPAQPVSANIAYSGAEKPFLASFRPDGGLRFAKILDDAGAAAENDRFWDLAVDNDGNIYAAGSFSGRLNLNPGGSAPIVSANPASATVSGDLFLASYTRDGAYRWGFPIGGPGSDAGTPVANTAPGGTGGISVGLFTNAQGTRAVVSGTFEQTAEFRGTSPAGPLTSSAASANGRDLFVAAYNIADGTLSLLNTFGNSGQVRTDGGSLRADGGGHVWLAAAIQASSGNPFFMRGSCSGVINNGFLLARLGNDLACERAVALQSAGGPDAVTKIAATPEGVFFAGWYNGRTDFDPGPLAQNINNVDGGSGTDGYVAHLTVEAVFDWVSPIVQVTPHGNPNQVAALTVDGYGNPWVGGQFHATTDFDPANTTGELVSRGGADGFVMRVNGCGFVEGPTELCRLGAQGKISGSWIESGRPGEGWILEMYGNGRAGMYWYTYPPRGTGTTDKQVWIVANGRVLSDRIEFEQSFTGRGTTFGAGFDPSRVVLTPWGRLTFRFSACNRATLTYQGPAEYARTTRNLQLLSGVDAHTCGLPAGSVYQMGVGRGASGSFYELASAGQGFSVHALPDGTAILTFYTYDLDGSPMWLVGGGQYDGQRLIVSDMLRGLNTFFGPDFSDLQVRLQPWGSMRVEFIDCQNARIRYESSDSRFGSGIINAVRLAAVTGVRCPGLQEE